MLRKLKILTLDRYAPVVPFHMLRPIQTTQGLAKRNFLTPPIPQDDGHGEHG